MPPLHPNSGVTGGDGVFLLDQLDSQTDIIQQLHSLHTGTLKAQVPPMIGKPDVR